MVELEQIDSCLWTLFSFLIQLFQSINKAVSMSMLRFTRKTIIVHEPVGKEILKTQSAHETTTCMEENRFALHINDHTTNIGTKVNGEENVSGKQRKRPARIVIPDVADVEFGFKEMGKWSNFVEDEVAEVEGGQYCLASKKGRGHALMEDTYDVITSIDGASQQAFFGVYDGHGGSTAADFVSKKLGKNIITAISGAKGEEELRKAIKAGYLLTDKEFLSQDVRSGACAATVLLKDEELYVANVGDCRVVMSRNGVATSLTTDHNAGREDERTRIQISGGYVNCHNGRWRVQDSLAVSRAIGDVNMKQWIIAEPDITKVGLTSDCEFLIIASDGLWDKVTNQEAVDAVSRNKGTMKSSCKELVDMSFKRGSRDDITVMVVDLHRFPWHSG